MANKSKQQNLRMRDRLPYFEDDYLRELMSRATNGIGGGPGAEADQWAEARTTFRTLARLNLLEQFDESIENARASKELIKRLSPTPMFSVPVWFVNEVMYWLIKDHGDLEILYHNMIPLDYLRIAQVASCALWNLGLGRIGDDGICEFERLAWTRRWVLYRE